MKNHLFIFSIISFAISTMQSQNLLSNGGFEFYYALPTIYNQINLARGWSNCNGNYATQGTWGSPDYKHTLGTGFANLPGSYVASTIPHSGNGVAGFVTYNGFCPDCREYIRTSLSTPMIVGGIYSVSFYATTGFNNAAKYVSNNIGVLFSTDSTWQPGAGNVRLNCSPQYNMNAILDTNGWKQISFTFTADSAYKYMTVGSFKTDANTTLIVKNGSSDLYAYNFVDDFSVIAISTGFEENSTFLNNVMVYPNPNNGEAIIRATKEEQIEIIDEFGQTLISLDLNKENNYSYELKGLSSGIYFACGKYSRRKVVVIK